jgi:hypothetical protein
MGMVAPPVAAAYLRAGVRRTGPSFLVSELHTL